MLLQAMGERFAQDQQPAVAALFLRKAKVASADARQMHGVIVQQKAFSGDLQFCAAIPEHQKGKIAFAGLD